MMIARWVPSLIGLGVLLQLAAPAMADEAASTVTAEYVQSYDARQGLRVGAVANQFEDYDLATAFYQQVIEKFPNTRWARQAERGIAQVKADAAQHLSGWDPSVGATQTGVQAQRLLRAGDTAYSVRDYLTALKFYERAGHAAPGSRYAARGSSKARWTRRWHNPGP